MSDIQLDRTKRLIEALDEMLDMLHLCLFNLGYKWRSQRIINLSARIPHGERFVR